MNTLRYGYRVKEIKNDAETGGPKRGRNRNALRTDLNRDYGSSSNSGVRQSAPSGPLRKAFNYSNNSSRQTSLSKIGRPTTADSGSRSQWREQVRQQKALRRGTPPQRHGYGASSDQDNPPAPQAGGAPSTLTPQVRGPPVPESTPSPDALPTPTPSSTRGKSSISRESNRNSDGQRSTERPLPGKKRLHMSPLRTSKEARWQGAAADRAEAAKKTESSNRTKSHSSVSQDVPLVVESLIGEDTDSANEDALDAGSGTDKTRDFPNVSPAAVAEMEEEHADLVTDIINDQEGLVAAHREQIHQMMDLVKQEMSALDKVEVAGASIDEYVESLEDILLQKASIVSTLRRQLNSFKEKLEVEEELSASIGSSRNNSPAAKRSPMSGP